MPRTTHHAGTSPTGRRALAASLAALACAGIAAAPAPAASPSQPKAKLQRALDRVVAAGAPGATLLVRDGDRTVRLASGYGDLARRLPMRVGQPARAGGLTKSFTAAVVLQLAGERRLALGDTVAKWLPGAISNGDAITIRQLLNHTSGIFSYDKDPAVLAPYRKGDFTRVFDGRKGVRIAAARGPLFAPGAKLDYSNTNYVLLGMIVEAATGNPIDTELRDRIFAPLGLAGTSYATTSRIAGRHTHGYLAGREPVDVTALSPTLLGAAGAVVSTSADLAAFYRALLGGRLLAPGLLATMQEIDPAATGGVADAGILGGGWGLGLLRETFACGTAWGHDSEIPGYMTAAWNSPDAGRQVVVTVNSNHGHDEPVSRAMRKLIAAAYCG